MPTAAEATLPSTRRARKSVGGGGRENVTLDIASATAPSEKQRKLRSKSMGPGGLDVLKSGTGNRRASLAASARPLPRSILKPTAPLLADIPPHKPKGGVAVNDENARHVDGADENSAQGTKIAVRTEEEQQAAAREREERERAEAEKAENDRREARRKSLANRRVSFAAEATLHTFHEIEYLQDSTTSTESTRRASSLVAPSPAPAALGHPGSNASEASSTPSEQDEDTVRGLHQTRRRRSSGAQSLSLGNNGDETINSNVYSSDSDAGDEVLEIHAEEASDSGSDSDEEDGTMMTVDAEEMTSASVVSLHSASSANSTADLDENLRLAAQRAHTGQLDITSQPSASRDDDEDGEEEIIPAFKGWIKTTTSSNSEEATAQKSTDTRKSIGEEDGEATMDVDMDMDVTGITGGIIHQAASHQEGAEDDVTMDATRALGGIIPQSASSLSPQHTPGDDTILGDESMDLTTTVGAIQPGRPSIASDIDGNEDMSMELTTAVGGLLAASIPKGLPFSNRRRSVAPKGIGNDVADPTVGMDMTMPLGGIIKSPSPTRPRRTAASPAEKVKSTAKEANASTPSFSPFRGKGLRRSPPTGGAGSQAKFGPDTVNQTPTKTPPARMIGSRSTSPKRLPASSKKETQNSPSKTAPKATALFNRDPTTGATTAKIVLTPQRRRLSGVGVDRTGLGSPKVAEILDRRESLGDGAAGFIPGQAASMLRRRVAFDDPRTLADEVDRERQDDEDRESGRKILEREADGSNDEKEVTLNLKEMIQGLSPKKSAMKNRKSLHVGSAKGLLGKRPAELDDEDDEEERDGIKRLRNHQGSPVKNIKLRSPPSKAETTGRVTRAGQRRLTHVDDDVTTPSTATAQQTKNSTVTTPKDQGRFKDVDDDHLSAKIDFSRSHAGPDGDGSAGDDDDDDGEQRIHLQDFLNMINIRFLELNTTKRRHTVAPSATAESAADDDNDEVSLERCVVAGACTVPMLELYQHSCRELKNYISEGRRIVKEIETEAFEENPPLFQEYLTASPEFKALMDNQFKNVKAHARLLSKAMWYEWRMKLQDGLKDGLMKIMDGMTDDERALQKQEELLGQALPGQLKRFESLESECADLELAAQELADCDPADLEAARLELIAVDEDIDAKTLKVAELEQQLRDTEAAIISLTEQKQSSLDDIAASEKVRQECRGWTSGEVASLKAKAEAIENQHGWAITGIAGTIISMTYHREIELVFDAASFQPAGDSDAVDSNARIDLWYIAGNREREPQPLTPEKEFMLQCVRDHVRSLPQRRGTKAGRLLAAVSASWDKARALARELRLVRTTFCTEVARTSDASVAVRASMLLAPLQTKVDVVLDLHCRSLGGAESGVEVAIAPRAAVVYGEQFNAAKMGEFLATRLGSTLRAVEEDSRQKQQHQSGVDGEQWVDALLDLQTRLLARGKKATPA